MLSRQYLNTLLLYAHKYTNSKEKKKTMKISPTFGVVFKSNLLKKKKKILVIMGAPLIFFFFFHFLKQRACFIYVSKLKYLVGTMREI